MCAFLLSKETPRAKIFANKICKSFPPTVFIAKCFKTVIYFHEICETYSLYEACVFASIKT